MRVQGNFQVWSRYVLQTFLLVAVSWRTVTVGDHARASTASAELQQQVTLPFRFVAFGDTRFTHSESERISNGEIRRAIVRAIGKEKPAFISIGGDIVYKGDDPDDWKVWDGETQAWKRDKIAVYPALGNHDLHGNESKALENYFQRFPQLNG